MERRLRARLVQSEAEHIVQPALLADVVQHGVLWVARPDRVEERPPVQPIAGAQRGITVPQLEQREASVLLREE